MGSFWGFFVANTWKPKFCKNMLNPIFSLYAPAASCKKEKLNAVICYNTWKTDLRHFLSKNFYSRYFLIKVIYMNFEPLCCSNLEDQKRPMHRFFERKKKKKMKYLNWTLFDPKTSKCFEKKNIHSLSLYAAVTSCKIRKVPCNELR